MNDRLYENFSDMVVNHNLLNGIDHIVCLFSGGKDATILLQFLRRYLKEKNLEVPVNVVMVTYPKHMYFDGDKKRECYIDLLDYWKKQDVIIDIFIPEQEDFADNCDKSCEICKKTRKSFVDPYLYNVQRSNKNKTIGVMTGYSLYDILAYYELIGQMTNKIKNMPQDNTVEHKRINGMLHKFKPREELPNNLVMLRPLLNMREDLIKEYLAENKIPYITKPCKAGSRKFKRIYFKKLDGDFGIENGTYDELLSSLKMKGVQLPTTFEEIKDSNYFIDC